MADIDHDDYLSDDDLPCPRCDGWGHIDCHCGGDLCVCENYGDAPCPLCCGDGQVSQARYDQHQATQRAWWAAYQAALSKRAAKSSPKANTRISTTTSKRAKVKAARKQRQRNG